MNVEEVQRRLWEQSKTHKENREASTPLFPTSTYRHLADGVVVAEHERDWGVKKTHYNPIHYLSIAERRPNGLDFGAPFAAWQPSMCCAAVWKSKPASKASGNTSAFCGCSNVLLWNNCRAALTARWHRTPLPTKAFGFMSNAPQRHRWNFFRWTVVRTCSKCIYRNRTFHLYATATQECRNYFKHTGYKDSTRMPDTL